MYKGTLVAERLVTFGCSLNFILLLLKHVKHVTCNIVALTDYILPIFYQNIFHEFQKLS